MMTGCFIYPILIVSVSVWIIKDHAEFWRELCVHLSFIARA